MRRMYSPGLLDAVYGNFSGSSGDPIHRGVIAKLMDTIKIHAKADAYGVVHLDVPVSEPNSEFDIEIALNPSHTPVRRERPYAWDAPFFERVLGDRVHRRRARDLTR
jgi:hypothetical protein